MKRFWGWLVLLGCAAVIIWHSLCISFSEKFNQLTRTKVNRRLREGAAQLLALIGAKYSISFVPDFNMENNQNNTTIFMANHLSLFDLPLLYATLSGTTRFLVKKSLFKMPVFGSAITQSEFIPIDMKNPDSMAALFLEAKEKLERGVRIFIFPEGTRSRTGKLGPLKPGGFRLARELGAQIVPIGIIGTNKALPPKTFSLQRGQTFILRVGHPIDTNAFPNIESQKLLMDKVASAVQELCQEKI